MKRLTLLVFVGIAVACGSKGSGFGADGGNDGSPGFGDGSTDGPGFNTGDAAGSLTIQPASATLLYTGSPVSQQFNAYNGTQEITSGLQWSIDNVLLGSIDGTGLFSASGVVGGVADVTAQMGTATGTGTVLVQLQITANPGSVPTGVISQLKAGGTSDSAFSWVYPYNQTLWPRGLSGPVLQFNGSPSIDNNTITYAWLHIETTSKSIVYDGYYGASNPGRIDLSNDPIWNTVGLSAGPSDVVNVSVTKIANGQVTGPITESWTFAQTTLKGTGYYNSYDSTLGNGYGTVLKIKPGPGAAATLLIGGTSSKCTVCHTVSSDGSTLIAANTGYGTGAKYNLLSNAAQSQPRTDYVYNFPAVYTDGSVVVATTSDKIGGMWSTNASLVYDGTGTQMTGTGFESLVQYSAMPAFSPDGTLLAFNNEGTADENAASPKNEIDILTWTNATKKFSGLTQIVADTNTTNLLGWPSFTPDSKFVLYDHHQGDNSEGVNYGTWGAQRSALEMADTSTKTVYPMNWMNGLNGSNMPYLPFGADDENRNFEPNVLPIAAGGYFWVVFTSRRQYGNTINSAETGTYGQDIRKKLWVAAIDINPTPGTDPSHVPFYLPGQEDSAGNMRGFWVLDPCEQNGNSCDSGDECCTGFCRQVTLADGGTEDVCVPPPGGCSHEFEKCTSSGDCCGTTYSCINGFCAAPAPN